MGWNGIKQSDTSVGFLFIVSNAIDSLQVSNVNDCLSS